MNPPISAYAAAEILATTFGVNRAGYGTIDPVSSRSRHALLTKWFAMDILADRIRGLISA